MFSDNGIIGRSGKWYGCKRTEHIPTRAKYNNDSPFVMIYSGNADFEAYYTSIKAIPTRAQFETLMDWCIFMKMKFEDVVNDRIEPWDNWL